MREALDYMLKGVARNLQNGFGTQYGLIIQGFGFTTLQTTLLNIPSGAVMIISITSATLILRRYPVGSSACCATFLANLVNRARTRGHGSLLVSSCRPSWARSC